MSCVMGRMTQSRVRFFLHPSQTRFLRVVRMPPSRQERGLVLHEIVLDFTLAACGGSVIVSEQVQVLVY